MRNNNDAKIIIAVGTIAMAASLFIITVTITMAPLQAYALSRYVVDDPNPADDVTNGKTDQSIQQDDLGNTAQSSPNIPTLPTGSCYMNTNEDPENFLSCFDEK
jgi:hypothetical protein